MYLRFLLYCHKKNNHTLNIHKKNCKTAPHLVLKMFKHCHVFTVFICRRNKKNWTKSLLRDRREARMRKKLPLRRKLFCMVSNMVWILPQKGHNIPQLIKLESNLALQIMSIMFFAQNHSRAPFTTSILTRFIYSLNALFVSCAIMLLLESFHLLCLWFWEVLRQLSCHNNKVKTAPFSWHLIIFNNLQQIDFFYLVYRISRDSNGNTKIT